MFKIQRLVIILAVFFTACANQQDIFVSSSNPDLEYSGRVGDSDDDRTEIYWSGSSVRINFEGESIQALLQDETGDNYFNVILDYDSIMVLYLDSTKRYYELASNLSAGAHTLEIFKRTEWDRGSTAFYGFLLGNNAKVLPKLPIKKRKLEFYGNSITAGYGVEDTSGKDRPDSIFTNNYLSYSALTARHYDAQYQCICKSGIGITISWFPYIMPDIYNRLNPADSLSAWDFSRYTPDVVVVNLFQNDSWLVNWPERAEFKANFGEEAPSEEYIISAYADFIEKLRKHYPHASIVCVLGNMDITEQGSVWPAYVEKAVASLNDEKIHTHFVPYKNTPGHPSVKEQEALSRSLIHFIDEHVEW